MGHSDLVATVVSSAALALVCRFLAMSVEEFLNLSVGERLIRHDG